MAKEPEKKKGGGEPKPPKSGAGGGGGGGERKSKGGGSAAAPKVDHAGVGIPAPPPRLREFYQATVRPRLMKQFSLGNLHEIPGLEKIVLNVGFGEAIKQPKLLEKIVDELGLITGQRPVRKKAKKSIANFGLREGQEIGVCVTLRGPRMWEFLDRFISIAIPRIRDFRGLSTRSFDGRGNYSMGVKEQMIFPEINYDMVDQIHGMDVTFVTTSRRDDHALALLRELGMPFRGEEKGSKIMELKQ
jgi:large subunit ribosomal protein L5